MSSDVPVYYGTRITRTMISWSPNRLVTTLLRVPSYQSCPISKLLNIESQRRDASTLLLLLLLLLLRRRRRRRRRLGFVVDAIFGFQVMLVLQKVHSFVNMILRYIPAKTKTLPVSHIVRIPSTEQSQTQKSRSHDTLTSRL